MAVSFAATTAPTSNLLGDVTQEGDGVADAINNCTLAANADQRDTNADGFGNICDPYLDNNGIVNFVDISLWAASFNTATTGDADLNGDGFANSIDYSINPDFFLQSPGLAAIPS